MHGLVSLLDQPHNQLVESIWQTLDEECGLTGIKVTPFPHFSWLIGSDFEWKAFEFALQEIAAQASPLTVRTTGLGLFTGSNPVVFIPIIRTKELSEFHQLVWERIQPFGEGLSSYYSPAYWSPHISLAYSDVTPANLSCVMNRLAFQTYNWEIRIDNISFISEPDSQVGTIRYRYGFNG